jgi:hypothetical protein
MPYSEYVKTVNIADTVVHTLSGRSVIINGSTVSQLETDDVDVHGSFIWDLNSENDAIASHSFIGKLSGRVVKMNYGCNLFSRAEVIEGKNWFSFVTHANNVQGTINTMFTVRSAAVFAGILLMGLALIKRRRKF